MLSGYRVARKIRDARCLLTNGGILWLVTVELSRSRLRDPHRNRIDPNQLAGQMLMGYSRRGTNINPLGERPADATAAVQRRRQFYASHAVRVRARSRSFIGWSSDRGGARRLRRSSVRPPLRLRATRLGRFVVPGAGGGAEAASGRVGASGATVEALCAVRARPGRKSWMRQTGCDAGSTPKSPWDEAYLMVARGTALPCPVKQASGG